MRIAAALLALGLAACGQSATQTAATQCLKEPGGDVAIQGGTMMMGARAALPGEGPPKRVSVKPFRIDRTDVTNAQFAAFVAATGYVTRAERGPSPSSLVFVGPQGQIDLSDPSQWWRIVEGADWRHPAGPDSTLEGRDHLPVVHVAYEDALAYAAWRGRDLPTEAEWEFAARGGLEGAVYAWGDEARDSAAPRANTWDGAFPLEDKGRDGFKAAASPVGCFPPNGFGLYDMTGNVWQWTKDVWRPGLFADPETAPETAAYDPRDPYATQRVFKGGSSLCADTVLRDDNQHEASLGEGTP